MNDFEDFLKENSLESKFAEYQAAKLEKEKIAAEKEKARLKEEDKQLRKEFAQRLKQARQAAGLKQSDVALKIKVAPATIASYEQAASAPQIATLIRIAQALNVSTDKLLGLI